MATLQGKAIKDTYKDLLQVSSTNNTGVTTAMKTVEDGEGTSSALGISTTDVKVTGNLEVTGNVTGIPHVDYRGNYSASTAYVKDDVVFYNGSSYIAKQSSTGNAPTNTTYWGLLAQKGTDGVDGTTPSDGVDGVDGDDGLGFTGGSYDASTGVVTFTSNDGLGFSTGDLRGASGTNANLNFSENANGAGIIANSVGSTTDGLIVTNQQPTLQIILNASTGSSDSSTRADYRLEGLRLRCNRAFVNVQTAEDYLFKFHNGHQGIVDFRLETNITDATFTPKMDQRYCGKYFIGEGAVRKWTITNLGALPITQIRGQLYLQDIHVCVNGNPNGVNNLFEVFEGGYTLLNNGVAIELGSGVKFNFSIFFNYGSTFYNEANPLELKNNLTAGDYQPLHAICEGALAYVRNEVVFSGQYSTALFGQGGGSFMFGHAFQYAGDQASNRGPFIMESNYSLPSQYISNGVPAFNFACGQAQVFHQDDPVTTDIMRYTIALGSTERFDRHVLTTTASTYSHTGVEPFERNLIMYSHGNKGSSPSHSNFRGWVYWGVTPNNNMPAKKSFQII